MKLIKTTIIAIASLLIFWQVIIVISDVQHFILPSPYLVFLAFVNHADLIGQHAVVTLAEVILGLLIGVVLGICTALCLEWSASARLFVKPILIFSQAIPVFAIAPVLTLWLGYGLLPKITMTILIIYFPVTSAFYDGLSSTPKGFLDLASVMDGAKWRQFVFIKIPAAIPSLCSGMKLAAVYAPIGAIIGEWVGASQGLGYLMLLANGQIKTDLMFAALFTLGLMSMALYGFIVFGINYALARYYL